FGGLALGLVGTTSSPPIQPANGPAGADATAGAAALAAHHPGSGQHPPPILIPFPRPVWQGPAPLPVAQHAVAEISGIQAVTGPLNPYGVPLSAAQYAHLYTQLGPAQALPPTAPPAVSVPQDLYMVYRSTAQYVSADGATVQLVAMLADPSP